MPPRRARLAFTAALLCLVGALAGCNQADQHAPAGRMAESSVLVDSAGSGGAAKRESFLAYEHSVRIETAHDQVAAAHASVEAACRQAQPDPCDILESRVNTGESPTAFLKLRATAAQVKALVAGLKDKGEVTDQTTSAEDLAAPIADATKQLAMLTDYRGKLEGLQAKAVNDVESLIKLNRELAEVQSRIEALAGQQAHLMKRVRTEVLMLRIETQGGRSAWQPVGRALRDFGRNLAEGTSTAIIGVAFLLPWAVVLGLFGWLLRWLWKRRKR